MTPARGALLVAAVALVRGRVELPALGAEPGQPLIVRIRGAKDPQLRSARVMAAWPGWRAVLARARSASPL